MIRIVYEPGPLSMIAAYSESVELEQQAAWDLDTAVDMCRRLDTLIRTRGARREH